MKRILDLHWVELATRHPPALVEGYRARLEGSGPFFERAPGDQAARSLLDELAAESYLGVEVRKVCPACHQPVGDQEMREERCPCGFSFEHEEPDLVSIYFRPGRRSRDPRWVVTVHGMNTYGPWQEEFSWKLARIYGYAVPVAIYKYGKILISPLLLISQESYARRLVRRLREIRGEMQAEGYGDRPDVIAHSFGTWLLARALELDPDLCLGRVVLTGSIVAPDFQWCRFFAGDPSRVEAVLCHYSGHDRVVPLAQFFIPFSGPSGRYGFNNRIGQQRHLCHHFESAFGHSDYFAPAHLKRVMHEIWGPFLTLPDDELQNWGDPPGGQDARAWRRSPLGKLTHLIKYSVLLLLALLILAVLTALAFGLPDVVRLLSSPQWVK
jgi:pimeloyl-ACP methyl ester carboxylesterase